MGDSEVAVTHVTTDTTPTVTSIAASSGGSVVPTTANLSKPRAYVIADSVVRIHNPPYPQRLTETGLVSQPESEFLKELQNLYV